jgi:phosphohistidine phosphatase
MKNKPQYYYRQSALLPYKIENGEIQILLITSRNQDKWVIPKGIVEDAFTPRETAIKEAFEEAGVSGKTAKKNIGKYKYIKWGGTCVVKVFPCYVKNEAAEWDEMYLRKRKWYPLKKGLKKINNDQLEKLIKTYFKNNSKL